MEKDAQEDNCARNSRTGREETAMRKLLLVAMILGVFCVALSVAHAASPFVMKVGVGHPPTHSFVKGLEHFKEQVEKISQGRLRVEIYPNSQLGGEREMQESVALGNLEMTVSGLLAIYEPVFAALDVPYLFKDRAHIRKFHDSAAFKELASSLDAKNIKVLTYYEGGFRQVTNNVRPIHKVADLKGLKIRTPEIPAMIETFKQLGAVVTPMSFKELYGALRQGVVDGQENPVKNIHTSKFYEVQKHLAITNHQYNSGYVYMNNGYFNRLPADLQQLLLKAVAESSVFQVKLDADTENSLLEDLKKNGMQVTTPDEKEFREATKGVYDVFYQRYGDKAKRVIEQIISMR
jgi:tripartite ATP-independent transporter DctP family solute receptor